MEVPEIHGCPQASFALLILVQCCSRETDWDSHICHKHVWITEKTIVNQRRDQVDSPTAAQHALSSAYALEAQVEHYSNLSSARCIIDG